MNKWMKAHFRQKFYLEQFPEHLNFQWTQKQAKHSPCCFTSVRQFIDQHKLTQEIHYFLLRLMLWLCCILKLVALLGSPLPPIVWQLGAHLGVFRLVKLLAYGLQVTGVGRTAECVEEFKHIHRTESERPHFLRHFLSPQWPVCSHPGSPYLRC